MQRHKKYFSELSVHDIRDSVVVIDVQGTIIGAYHFSVDEATKKVLTDISKHNDVYLFSNCKQQHRIAAVAHAYALPHIRSDLYKPDPRIMRLIPNPHHKPLVVIGDLVLTDGIFARLTGSHFVYVEHLRHKSDTWLVKLMYLVDDAAASVAYMLHWMQRVWQKRNIRA